MRLLASLLFANLTAAAMTRRRDILGPEDKPVIEFTGKTHLPTRDGWVIDTSPHGAGTFSGDRGVTYVYNCGQKPQNQPGGFDARACRNLGLGSSRNKPCGSGYDTSPPFARSFAPMCAQRESTHLVAFQSKDGKSHARLRAFKDACRWLGARCGPDAWEFAEAFIINGVDATKGRKINIDAEGIGFVRLQSVVPLPEGDEATRQREQEQELELDEEGQKVDAEENEEDKKTEGNRG